MRGHVRVGGVDIFPLFGNRDMDRFGHFVSLGTGWVPT